jgi:hypothetical protein
MKVRALVLGLAVTLAGVAACAPPPPEPMYAGRPQPHMYRAMDLLQRARQQLAVAAHNKGGHRVRALQLIDQAIVEVNRGIQIGDRP